MNLNYDPPWPHGAMAPVARSSPAALEHCTTRVSSETQHTPAGLFLVNLRLRPHVGLTVHGRPHAGRGTRTPPSPSNHVATRARGWARTSTPSTDGKASRGINEGSGAQHDGHLAARTYIVPYE